MLVAEAQCWLITGCSTGFGRALASQLLERGESVAVTARNPDTLAALVETYPDRALPLRLDVTRPDQVEAAVAAVRERFGRIDALVNNAGFGQLAVLEDTLMDAFRAMLETNVLGAFAMIHAVLPEMRARGSGRIVTIGSVAGLIGFPALTAYCASKAAMIGMSEALATEVRPLGIHVTIAELGPFATDFSRSMAVTAPTKADYDLAALSQAAGTAHWGVGDDPADGARALLRALDDPSPPLHLILGEPGLEVVERYETQRMAERNRWIETSRLRP